MKTKDKLDELEAQLNHLTNRIDNLRDKFVSYIEEENKPIKPLIKDEKIRRAVRAWAEANGIERVWHEYSSCWLRGNGLVIEMENEVTELRQGNYSIDELCGEEEE